MSIQLRRREFMALGAGVAGVAGVAQPRRRGRLLYEPAMDSAESLRGWVMEGPGGISCREGWMRMWSPFRYRNLRVWAED